MLGHSDRSTKSAYHIDEAVFSARQTPAVCYKDLKSLTNSTKPRAFALKIPDAKTKASDMHRKPKKSTEPDMGSYEPAKVKEKLRDMSGPSQKMSNTPITKYYDINIKRSKHVPGPGHYKTDQYCRIMSKTPNSIRVRRH